MLKILELFAGTRSVSKAFERRGGGSLYGRVEQKL